MLTSVLKNIGGYLALPLNGVPGVGLIPRASGSGSYNRYNGVRQTLSGTIGLPETKGTSTAQSTITSPNGYEWCLPPSMVGMEDFYLALATRTMTLSGTWVLVADGTQQAGEATVPPMYFASFSFTPSGDRSVSILPTNISVRISTLECTVNTPTAIDFGPVNRKTQANAELAVKPVPLITSCGQPSDRINANINLQFRQLSGLYGGAASRLALSQGGGYITGEIDNGMTGSGACTATTGLRFDNIAIKQGSITSAQSSTTLANQLTWRLCSGGSSLPSGPVTASAEMLVTFN
ncbi:adhesin (plasmid) [Serratia sp. L9]|uniref:adhesin n=1 Tax=Serratia sp. L9 TaxID=3423946 RepID=UPI003D674A9A